VVLATHQLESRSAAPEDDGEEYSGDDEGGEGEESEDESDEDEGGEDEKLPEDEESDEGDEEGQLYITAENVIASDG